MQNEAIGSRARWRTLSMECADADEMAAFYSGLLGWDVDQRGDVDPDTGRSGWVLLRNPGGDIALAFGAHRSYRPPVWPQQPGEQSMMMHCEIAVDDVQAGVDRALAAGGTIAPWQQPPDRDHEALRVILDPAGHPLCLFNDAPVE
jgi:catechol 2,3-dioxygenase-like lactoylglutathione lyase family enzyme